MSALTEKKAPTNGVVKEKKSQVTRLSPREMVAKRKNKGILSLMTQVAFGLAGKNKFEGTKLEGVESTQSGMVYQLTKENGKIDKLDEKGQLYQNLILKAKSCQSDLSSDELVYSKNVKAFIDELSKLQGASESKSVVLRGVKFE